VLVETGNREGPVFVNILKADVAPQAEPAEASCYQAPADENAGKLAGACSK